MVAKKSKGTKSPVEQQIGVKGMKEKRWKDVETEERGSQINTIAET